MSSVYFPVHVVVLLRRLVNVISTLSISKQYLLPKHTKVDEDTAEPGAASGYPHLQHTSAKPNTMNLSWRTFEAFGAVEWPWWTYWDSWDWPRFMALGGVINRVKMTQPNLDDATVQPTGMGTETGRFRPHDNPAPPSPHSNSQKSFPKFSPPVAEPDSASLDIIHQLLKNPALYDPLRTPRYPIVLCHGLYGFDVRGPSSFPSLRMHYWQNVLSILRDKVGAEVIITSVPGTGSITSRSESMDRQLQAKAKGRGINFLAHSMGGLDCRHLISHVKPTEYNPLSLTTISTPHRGSPFMDWCAENLGLGKIREREELADKSLSPDATNPRLPPQPPTPPPSAPEANAKPETPSSLSLSTLPSSFTTLLLSILDSPAYANLTSAYLNTVFNPATPDDPRVKYFSVAGRMPGVSVWHPFWLPKMVLDGVEEKWRKDSKAISEATSAAREELGSDEREETTPLWARDNEWGNDGLVTVQSAKWGTFLGIMEGCDHWEMRGARGIEFGVDLPALPGIGRGNGDNGGSDGWGLRDWGRFVGAWRKEEKFQKDAAAAADKAKGQGRVQASLSGKDQEREQERQREKDDAVIKSSTDKLSAVVDWLVDQVPVPPGLGAKGKVLANAEMKGVRDVAGIKQAELTLEVKEHTEEGKGRKQQELATKMDLERFYVAMSRNLYDVGL